MDGKEHRLLDLLKGENTSFVIPLYQRRYTWTSVQCDQLLDDLKEVLELDSQNHFFGSLVSQTNVDENRLLGANERRVIDGQQRITTVFLLLIALEDLIRSGKIISEDAALADTIRNDYLTYTPQKGKPKLELTEEDRKDLKDLFDGKTPQHSSNVFANYSYLCERLEKKKEFTADALFDALGRLLIVDIKVYPQQDNAQRIFESLNSTGLALTEGDKIRNFILMDLEPEEQNNLYTYYWNPIESNTVSDNTPDTSAFIRSWLTAMCHNTPKVDEVYSTFKKYVYQHYTDQNSIDTETLLKDLLDHSRYYREIVKSDTTSPDVNTILHRLIPLNISVIYPYLLNLFDYWNHGHITDEEVVECLSVIEIYLFRRWVCQFPSNALPHVFETLHRDTLGGVARGGSYPDVLKSVLLTKEGNSRFPNDTEFKEGFNTRDFYTSIGNYKFYLYDRLECAGGPEYGPVSGRMQDDGKLTVEHVMPQTLSRQWRKDLGRNAKRIHDTWINKMANLTLTGYNSRYSNRPFTDKRDMKDGFKDSPLYLNKFIREQTAWGEKQLKERNALLQKEFLELWPMITSTFTLEYSPYEEHALYEDFDFSGRKLHAFTYKGVLYPTTNWKDMMYEVLELVYESDASVFNKYLPDDAEFPAHYFFAHKRKTNAKIGQGVYFKSPGSTNSKIEVLKVILDKANIDPSELVFEIYKRKEEEY